MIVFTSFLFGRILILFISEIEEMFFSKRKKGKRRIARTKVWGESGDKMLGKTLCPFHEG